MGRRLRRLQPLFPDGSRETVMAKVHLTVRGTNILWNGSPRQLKMATSFGWLGLLWNNKTDGAKRWLDRMQGIGMDGIRVFGEYKGWEHNGFFFQVPPLYDVWDWGAHKGSDITVSPAYGYILRKAVELLQERGMIMEYTVSATAKSLTLIPGFREHMCRAVAQFFDQLAPDGAHNTMFEIENEYDVHNQQSPLAPGVISEIGRRWRIARPERPDRRPDHPNTLLSISEGGEGAGNWDIRYPVKTLSHINVHSPRQHEWEDVGVDIALFQ